MTACPIRYQRQVSDRKGKIFYTSITSLSHISKVSGHQAAHGWRRCGADRHDPHPSALRSVRLIRQPRRSNHRGGCWKRHSPLTIHQRFKEEIQVWHLSIRQLRFSRRLLSPSAQVLRCGVLSTSWKATATTTPALSLRASSSSWLIKGNKKKGKAQSRRYQRQATRINCDFTRLVL